MEWQNGQSIEKGGWSVYTLDPFEWNHTHEIDFSLELMIFLDQGKNERRRRRECWTVHLLVDRLYSKKTYLFSGGVGVWRVLEKQTADIKVYIQYLKVTDCPTFAKHNLIEET